MRPILRSCCAWGCYPKDISTRGRDVGRGIYHASACSWCAVGQPRFFRSRASQFLFQESNLGSTRPGKYADLLVLDRDYLKVPADKLKVIKPLITIVGGKFAYRGGKPWIRDLPRRGGESRASHRSVRQAGRSAAVVNESAKNSFSGSPHWVVKSCRAASTITGTPQA